VEQEFQVKEIQVDVENKDLYMMQVVEEDLEQLVIQVQILQTNQLVEQDQM
jgi:intein-encoded DNA endonuclease-like protein